MVRVRELAKSNNDGMQMTVATGGEDARSVETGAPSTSQNAWSQIDWKRAEQQVFRLQMRIAKATQMGLFFIVLLTAFEVLILI
jgi:hypothetical protein